MPCKLNNDIVIIFLPVAHASMSMSTQAVNYSGHNKHQFELARIKTEIYIYI